MRKLEFTNAGGGPGGRDRYMIGYNGRDVLGFVTFFQDEWHSDFRFNGKDFELRSETLDKAKAAVRAAITKEEKSA